MIEVTHRENTLWQQLAHQTAANRDIKDLAYEYYLQYREYLKKTSSHKQDSAEIIMRIAYFLSEKTQKVYNLKGERISNVSLSLNNIIKNSAASTEFIYHLKEMIRHVDIDPQFKHVQQEINNLTRKFSFILPFHKKFISTLKKIKIRMKKMDHQLSESSLQEWDNSLLWLIFIQGKSAIVQDQFNIVEYTCLMTCIFTAYVTERYCEKNVCSIYFDDENNPDTFSNQEAQIEESLLEYFKLKDLKAYFQVKEKYDQYMRCLSKQLDIQQIYTYQRIEFNYRKLDKHYQKKMNDWVSTQQEFIDERQFLKSRINGNFINLRFTPFGGKSALGARKKNKTSFKILNFDESKIEPSQQNISDNTSAIKIIEKLKQTPNISTPKVPLIKATPMTEAMQIYNWLFDRSKHTFLDQENKERIEEILSLWEGYKKVKNVEQNIRLINGLWQAICSLEEELDSETITTNLILSTLLTNQVTNVENQSLPLALEHYDLDWFSFWCKLDGFINSSFDMPDAIKINLLALETEIITDKLWKHQSSLIAKQKAKDTSAHQRLQKRIIHHLAYQIVEIGKQLQVDESLFNRIFMTTQLIYHEKIELFEGRNLNQLLICLIFACGRQMQLQLKMKQIVEAFSYVNLLTSNEIAELTGYVKFNQETQTNLISFYNQIFITETRKLLMEVCEDSAKLKQELHVRKCCTSPLKEIIPRNQVIGKQSPKVQALFAYTESPLLKRKQSNRKMIARQGLLEYPQKGLTAAEELTNTIDMINNKFRGANSSAQKPSLNTTWADSSSKKCQNSCHYR